MNYYIGQELQLPKVHIVETWGGVTGQDYFKTDVGVSFTPKELEKLCPPPAPRNAIDDYFPMVKERIVPKREYKVGDNVRIKSDLHSLVDSLSEGRFLLNRGMEIYFGKKDVIKEVGILDQEVYYKLAHNPWSWVGEWVEPYKPSKYEGMSDVYLVDAFCRRRPCYECFMATYSRAEGHLGILERHPEFRAVILSTLIAEDAAQEQT